MKFHNKTRETCVVINYQRCLLVQVLVLVIVLVPNKRYRTDLCVLQLLDALKTHVLDEYPGIPKRRQSEQK